MERLSLNNLVKASVDFPKKVIYANNAVRHETLKRVCQASLRKGTVRGGIALTDKKEKYLTRRQTFLLLSARKGRHPDDWEPALFACALRRFFRFQKIAGEKLQHLSARLLRDGDQRIAPRNGKQRIVKDGSDQRGEDGEDLAQADQVAVGGAIRKSSCGDGGNGQDQTAVCGEQDEDAVSQQDALAVVMLRGQRPASCALCASWASELRSLSQSKRSVR